MPNIISKATINNKIEPAIAKSPKTLTPDLTTIGVALEPLLAAAEPANCQLPLTGLLTILNSPKLFTPKKPVPVKLKVYTVEPILKPFPVSMRQIPFAAVLFICTTGVVEKSKRGRPPFPGLPGINSTVMVPAVLTLPEKFKMAL